ncbi:MAG: condensation domain-containing protein [Candidatus Competibacteraceae bacterium]
MNGPYSPAENLQRFLAELNRQGIMLWLDGDYLRYRAPKGVLTATLRAELVRRKAELLAFLQQAQQKPAGSAPPGRKETPEESSWLPLLYTQRNLIPPQTAVEKTYVNNGPLFAIRAEIDLPALQRACQDLAARHAALRLQVACRNGVLMQQVQPKADVPFAVIDISAWSQAQLIEKVATLWSYGFDLEREPPLRVYLFTRAPDDHILLLLSHHIAIDGWSMQIIWEELPLLYQAQLTGSAAALPELLWSFTDYLHWQHDMLSGPEGERLWHYWQQQLSGTLPVLNLPTDHPRPALISHRGTGYEFHLTGELTRQLRQLVQRKGTTLYVVLQAALQLLLHGLSGQQDILVGGTVNNRVRPELDRLVGSLVDVVVLRSILPDEPAFTFTHYLSQVQRQVLEALAHQGYPSALIAERLGIQTDAGRPPLVQVSLNYLHAAILSAPAAQKSEGSGVLTLERCELPIPLVGNWEEDLILGILEEPDRLHGLIRYNTDLFEASTIARLVESFRTLLQAIVDQPEQPISALLTTRRTECIASA